jgi:hypothetical protein
MKFCRLPVAFLVLASFFLIHPSSFGQGSLTPPGPPAPTMKALDQIEPRRPISLDHTPGDAVSEFIISLPGSYYMTSNITGLSGKTGISITADDVTVDLNGFALIGLAGSLNGISVQGAQKNLRIRNGSAQNWGSNGIACQFTTNSQFDHLRVSQNGAAGFNCGDRNVLSNMTAEANTGDGIRTGNSCTVTASTAASNVNGFNIQNQCTIIGCTAVSNSNRGIFPSNDCTIKDCTAVLNGVKGIETGDRSLIVNCTANSKGTGTSGSGIKGGIRQTVKNCNASENQASGIVVLGDSFLLENHASHNGRGVTAIGIDTSGGSGSRVEGNDARDNNNIGFFVTSGDLVIRNSAGGNTTLNYSSTSGTNFAPVQSASTATNPFANF